MIVALSGGRDSVCLLHVLRTLGYHTIAAHCNFHLRGAESDRDEQFVRQLCAEWGIQLHVRHFDTYTYAQQNKKSIEEAARELRYEWFATLTADYGCHIAVAHHQNDNAETLLLNLLRGSGLTGLTGMPPKRVLENGMVVVRPLLCLKREEIDTCIAANNLPYVDDSTNATDEARRNFVRHNLLPLMTTVNPSIIDTLCQTAQRLTESRQIYNHALEMLAGKCLHDSTIDKYDLLATPAPRTVLHAILSPLGFNSEQTERIYEDRDGEPGAIYESEGWRLLRDRDRWLLQNKSEQYPLLTQTLPLEGVVQLVPDHRLTITRHTATDFVIPKTADTACFDLERLTFPLTVRFLQDGDRFTPFGMRGSRLVSDYMTDLHSTLFDKERQLVLLSGSEIAWVVGKRIAAPFAITDKTRFVIKMSIE